MAYCNFTTFDNIGYISSCHLRVITISKWCTGILLSANPSGPLKAARIPLLSGLFQIPPPSEKKFAKLNRNVIESIKFLGLFRFMAIYPALPFTFQLLELLIPSFTAKRVAHLAFTTAQIEKRLDTKTDRKDFITYASFPSHLLTRYATTPLTAQIGPSP